MRRTGKSRENIWRRSSWQRGGPAAPSAAAAALPQPGDPGSEPRPRGKARMCWCRVVLWGEPLVLERATSRRIHSLVNLEGCREGEIFPGESQCLYVSLTTTGCSLDSGPGDDAQHITPGTAGSRGLFLDKHSLSPRADLHFCTSRARFATQPDPWAQPRHVGGEANPPHSAGTLPPAGAGEASPGRVPTPPSQRGPSHRRHFPDLLGWVPAGGIALLAKLSRNAGEAAAPGCEGSGWGGNEALCVNSEGLKPLTQHKDQSKLF